MFLDEARIAALLDHPTSSRSTSSVERTATTSWSWSTWPGLSLSRLIAGHGGPLRCTWQCRSPRRWRGAAVRTRQPRRHRRAASTWSTATSARPTCSAPLRRRQAHRLRHRQGALVRATRRRGGDQGQVSYISPEQAPARPRTAARHLLARPLSVRDDDGAAGLPAGTTPSCSRRVRRAATPARLVVPTIRGPDSRARAGAPPERPQRSRSATSCRTRC